MANVLERAVARVFNLATSDQVETLRSEISTLETRVKMRDTSSGVPFGYGQFQYEYLTQLSPDARWDVFDRMESDPMVKEGLDSVVLPLITGKWEIQAASDKPIDKEIAEFVSANLLRTSGDKYGRDYWTQTSWKAQRLGEILQFLKCGFALFNKSTRVVDGRVVFDRLQYLEPRSVDPHGWELSDTDELVEVLRTYRSATEAYKLQEPIKARQLALYAWDLQGARLEGRPKIRSVYGAWYRKDALVRYSAIWAQKAGAPMPVGHYPTSLPAKFIPKVEEAVKAMRGQAPAESYVVFPMGPDGSKVELGFAGMSGDGATAVDRMRSVISGENSEIAHGMGTKSRLLGETSSGSRSLGEEQSDDEDLYVEATKDLICEIENHGIGNLPGLVQQLVDWNFSGVKRYPELQCSRVGVENFKTLDPLTKAVGAKIVPLTPELRKQVTEKFGYRLPDEAYELTDIIEEQERLNPANAAPGFNGANGAKPPARNAPAQKETTPDDERAARGLSLRFSLEAMLREPDYAMPESRASAYGRTPTAFESKVCMLGMVTSALQAGGDHVSSSLRRARAQMIEDLLRRVGSGAVTRRTINTLRRSKPEALGTMVAAVRERFLDVAREGRQHAREELDRQKAFAREIASKSLSLSEIQLGRKKNPPEDEVPNVVPAGAAVPLAGEIAEVIADLVANGRVLSTLTTELALEAKVSTQIAVEEIWTRLLDESIAVYDRAIRAGASEAQALTEVETALHGLSATKLDLVGRQVASVAYNQGRDMAAKEAAVDGAAAWVLRSEVLDARTCQACAGLDGTMVKIGTSEYEQLMPPARCEGGDNCRGFYVILSKSLAAEMARAA